MSAMHGAAILPTVTHRVRGFLWAQGVRVKPWSRLDEVYEALYGLMRARRDDPAFWPELETLLEAIVECATEKGAGRLPAPQAELLSSWDIASLVKDMRAALPAPGGGGDRGSFRRFASGLAAPVLGGFMILGLVASGGCGSETTMTGDATGDAPVDTHLDTAADTPVDTGVDAPWAEGCELPAYSPLYTVLVDTTVIDDYEKASLCQCFYRLHVDWNDGLVELFATGTPDVVAAALYEMIECCRYDAGQLETSFDDVRDQFLDGSLCYVALPYRGVTFPER